MIGVRGRGWHTEILLPAWGVAAPLSSLLPAGAVALGLGFGKRDWMLAEGHASGNLLTGPLPGPAVVEIAAYHRPPSPPYWQLPAPPGGIAALSAFVWDSLALTDGAPRVAARFHNGRSFLDAAIGYSLAYTCNTWVAEALAAAGFAVNPAGTVLASGVLAQVARLPGACLLAPAATLRTSASGRAMLAGHAGASRGA